MEFFSVFFIYLSLVIIPTEMRNEDDTHSFQNIHEIDCVKCQYNDRDVFNLLNTKSERIRRSISKKEKLADNVECKPFIEEICRDVISSDDLTILDCILSNEISKESRISESCRNVIWTRSLDFLEEPSLRSAVELTCTSDIQDKSLSDCLSRSYLLETSPSPIISPFLTCILDKREAVQSSRCKEFLQRVERVVLFDFGQMVGPLAKYCEADVKKLECSHNEVQWEGSTLACLQLNLDHVQDERCRLQVMQLSELQAEDVHLDRQLFKACLKEYRNLCMNEKGDNADAYSCLIRNRLDKSVTKKCSDELSRRLGLMARDYKASKGLARACREDVRINHCRRRRPHAADEAPDMRLAHILLCLEGVIRNGSTVSTECRSRMVAHRRFLFEDYHTSPEVVLGCSNDVNKLCGGVEGAKIIHCLMENVRSSHRRGLHVSKQCHRALESLAKEADVGENWTVDPVLKKACGAVAEAHCSSAGDTGVMACLMELLGEEKLPQDCKTALLQIQYFVSREFSLDPVLYRLCHKDADRLCPAGQQHADDASADSTAMVLPCLYRHAYHPLRNPEANPSNACKEQLRRVMRQRAVSVDLQPEVEDNCLDELASLCQERTGRGEEMVCLQDNLEKLRSVCRMAVSNYTELEAGHVEINPIILSECKDIINKFCKILELYNTVHFHLTIKEQLSKNTVRWHLPRRPKNCERVSTSKMSTSVLMKTSWMLKHVHSFLAFLEELQDGFDKGGVMDCLVAHKNDPEVKTDGYRCRAAVEHFQLISLKSYHFSYKFKEACRPHVVRYCPKSKTKMDVVTCLSEKVRNETLSGQRPSISRDCRQQLRAQLFQRRESIDLDPSLKAACLSDAKVLCADVKHGDGQVLECLLTAKQKLSAICHRAIFNVEREELTDNSVDYTLLTACSKPLKQYCQHVDLSKALDCLKKFRNKPAFDRKCQSVVVRRMIEQSSDYRLNPALQLGCRQDIIKFCSQVVVNQPKDLELEGKVVKCLKVKFHEHQLKKDCEQQISTIVIEAALNYQMNPELASACKYEVDTLCQGKAGGDGAIEECLREKMVQGQLESHMCRVEVAASVRDSFGERLELDPLLHQACSNDDSRYCSHLTENSNHIQCLQAVLEENTKSLQSECKIMLIKRIKMFKNAAMIIGYPETMLELYAQVYRSPSRKYFLLVGLSCVGLFFILGLFCGRASRRNVILKKR